MKYVGSSLIMEDGLKFKVFRHMKKKRRNAKQPGSILIVRFKFKALSHEANIRASRIPIPMIGGFPGFEDKLWMIDWENGYWQGMYQWESEESIEKYKRSFVLGVMNKRAVKDSISSKTIKDMDIEEYLEKILVSE